MIMDNVSMYKTLSLAGLWLLASGLSERLVLPFRQTASIDRCQCSGILRQSFSVK